MATADAFDQLTLIAEIAATLMGFIAVFLVLSDREGRFAESDRHFIQALVVNGSMAIVFALLPRGLSFFVLGEELWTVSLVVVALIATFAASYQVRVQLKMSREEAARIHWGWHVTAWGLAAIAGIFVIAGLFGLADAIGMYVGATSFVALIQLWMFVAVVFRKFF